MERMSKSRPLEIKSMGPKTNTKQKISSEKKMNSFISNSATTADELKVEL